MLALPSGAEKPQWLLLQSMLTSECAWLKGWGRAPHVTIAAAAPPQLHALRLRQLSGILRWLERRVLTPLIRRFFHAEVRIAAPRTRPPLSLATGKRIVISAFELWRHSCVFSEWRVHTALGADDETLTMHLSPLLFPRPSCLRSCITHRRITGGSTSGGGCNGSRCAGFAAPSSSHSHLCRFGPCASLVSVRGCTCLQQSRRCIHDLLVRRRRHFAYARSPSQVKAILRAPKRVLGCGLLRTLPKQVRSVSD